ncbi:MAG: DUF930 domain-containing protein [Xanthobacteraceae bacterium]|nr:DUF930 domain-containing protein [Xanthobacteraceae bacterium]QYK44362.1 MAG: DUF930 domain-containing protein [Xanthobacteraceae bacterium]
MKCGYVAFAFGCLLLAVSPAHANKKRQKQIEYMLKRLDPSTRLEQVCELEAMNRIARDNREFRVDRSVIAAFSEPKVKGDEIISPGAAFRSKRKWYRYTFSCRATPDRMRVLSFEYKIGDEIPETQWSKHGLYQ